MSVKTVTKKYLAATTKQDFINYERSLKELVTQAIDKSQTKILIEKSRYRLTVYYENKAIKSYPVVLGGNPQGDKLREEDNKTPEGIFQIRDLYPHPQWSKFIWIDYPTPASWDKHLQAKRQGVIPFSASIGGEIGIHGVNSGGDYLIDEGNNWTLGCISLKNHDVDEIYSIVMVGTVIEIIP